LRVPKMKLSLTIQCESSTSCVSACISLKLDSNHYAIKGPLRTGLTIKDLSMTLLNLPEYNPFSGPAERSSEHHSDGDPQRKQTRFCMYRGGRFEVSGAGVHFVDDKGNTKIICSELQIEACTRDASNHEWGRLLRWRDLDGKTHTWAMPMSLLFGESSDLLKEFASRGLVIAPGPEIKPLLVAYLQTWDVAERVRCVERLGWHGPVFCTPVETIGDSTERLTFQSAGLIHSEFTSAGTVGQWRDSVAALATGNSRLIFAISVAFAGPLLALSGEDSGGFHFVGSSSSGKTTALRAAASTWGSPNTFVRQWRATANGLEGLAAAHNDGVLILDELGQIDGRQASEVAYMLANGKGKTRASRSGEARESAMWRLLFLSSGETGLSEVMESAGRRTNAGQELRLPNIPADAAAGLGMFEVLHVYASPAAFANAVKEASVSSYG
jgi:putative DNA primase/helicase